MTWIIRKFEQEGLPQKRWSYFEVNQYTQKDLEEFLPMDKTIDAVLGHMWDEYEPLMQRSKIEYFMIYVSMLKICLSQNYSWPDLRDEVKKMLSEGILEKYRPLLPIDEYELLASDIKELHLD